MTDQPVQPIRTNLQLGEVALRLSKLSKRGKLAGFVAASSSGDPMKADAQGTPFDSDLLMHAAQTDTGTQLRFEIRLRTKFLWIFIALLVVSIWPGLPLTDSFMRTFGWYERLLGSSIQTWMWYLPLTVIPTPFAIMGSIKKSKASALEHAIETRAKLCSLLEAED